MRAISSAVLFGLLGVLFSFISPAKSEGEGFRIHALLVIDTDADTKRTHGLEIAGNRMRELLNSLPAEDRTRLQLTVLKGQDATPDMIRKYYRQLQSTPMDVCYFYYMGHGGVVANRNNGSAGKWKEITIDFGSYNGKTGVWSAYPESSDPTYHVLAMNHGWMSRLEIYHLMLLCPSRASILFADCCASFTQGRVGRVDGPDVRPNTPARFAARMRGIDVSRVKLDTPGTINAELWRRLFYEHMGLIDLAGAPVGYFGLADSRFGGFSSFSFTELLCASNEDIIRMTNEKTNWPSSSGLPDWIVFQPCVLTPQYCQTFQQWRSERTVGGEERIYDFGPRLFDPMGQIAFTPTISQIPQGTAVFGLAKSGVFCRISPGSDVPAGFYFLNACDGDSRINYSNAKTFFEQIVRRHSQRIQIAQNPPPSSGTTALKVFDLSITPVK